MAVQQIKNQFGGFGIPFGNDTLGYTPNPFYRLRILGLPGSYSTYTAHTASVVELDNKYRNPVLGTANIKTNFDGTIDFQIKIDLQAAFLAKKEIEVDLLVNKLCILELGFTELKSSVGRHTASDKYTREWLFFINGTDVDFHNRNSLTIFGKDFYSQMLQGFFMKQKVGSLSTKESDKTKIWTKVLTGKYKLDEIGFLLNLFYSYVTTPTDGLDKKQFKEKMDKTSIKTIENLVKVLTEYTIEIVQTNPKKFVNTGKKTFFDSEISDKKTLFSIIKAYASQFDQLFFIRYPTNLQKEKILYLIFISPEDINKLSSMDAPDEWEDFVNPSNSGNSDKLFKRDFIKNIHLKMPFGEDNKIVNDINQKEVKKVLIDRGLFSPEEQNYPVPLDNFKIGVKYKNNKVSKVQTKYGKQQYYTTERVPIIRLFFTLPAYIDLNIFDRMFFEEKSAIAGTTGRKNYYIETMSITFRADVFDISYTALFWNGKGVDELQGYATSNLYNKFDMLIERALEQNGIFRDGIINQRIGESQRYALSTTEEKPEILGKKKYETDTSSVDGYIPLTPYAGANEADGARAFGFYFPQKPNKDGISQKGVKLNKSQAKIADGALIGQFWNDDEFFNFMQLVKGKVATRDTRKSGDNSLDDHFYHVDSKQHSETDPINKHPVFEEDDIVLLHESGTLIVMTNDGKLVLRGNGMRTFISIITNKMVIQSGGTSMTIDDGGVTIT